LEYTRWDKRAVWNESCCNQEWGSKACPRKEVVFQSNLYARRLYEQSVYGTCQGMRLGMFYFDPPYLSNS